MRSILVFLMLSAGITTNAQTILLQENFAGNTLPPGWYQDSGGVNTGNFEWKFTGWPTNLTGNGFDSSYPRVSGLGDYSLYSPVIHTQNVNTLYLTYGENYIGGLHDYFLKIETSTDNGLTWKVALNNIPYLQGFNDPTYRKVVDLTENTLNADSVIIRFHYFLGDPTSCWWAIDSVVVSDSAFCSMPSDSTGIVVAEMPYSCDGSPVNLKMESVSRGLGQTYQWQVKNALNGNVFTNITGATADTLQYAQAGESYYHCMVTCQSAAAATSLPALVKDEPVEQGYITSTINMGICSSVNDVLMLVSDKTDTAVGYQWMYSDSIYGTYTNLPGATDTFYTVSSSNFSNGVIMRCKQMCKSSGAFLPSNFWVEFLNQNPQCYCMGHNYNQCAPNPFDNFSGGITKVSIAGTPLNNASAACNNPPVPEFFYYNYTYFPPAGNATATLVKGQAYTFKVVIDTVIFGDALCSFWIDYNHNGNFDPYEFTQVSAVDIPAGDSATVSFIVPFNAVSGITGMRVRTCGNVSPMYPNSACSYLAGGETEDYMINIDTAVAVTQLNPMEHAVNVYPNPGVNGQPGFITVYGFTQKNKKLTIYSAEGKSVYTSQYTDDVLELPSLFAPGIYLVNITADDISIQKKWLVIE